MRLILTAALFAASAIMFCETSQIAEARIESPAITRKSVSLPKSRFKTESSAILEAKRKYPKFKVTKVKSLSKSWLVTMEG